MQTIVSKIRNLIQDNLDTRGRSEYEFHTSKIFQLTESNVDEDSIKFYRNGIEWSDSWEYDEDTGEITVEEETGTEELEEGEKLLATFSFYKKYSDDELEKYILAACSYICIEKYETFSLGTGNTLSPTPTEEEENLIAIIATILIKGSVRSYRTPEITINFNEGESIEKKIKTIIGQFSKSNGVIGYIDVELECLDYDDQDA